VGAAVATSPVPRLAGGRTAAAAALLAAYASGALLLVGEATVHIQQYFWLFHGVSWIGPLFLLNAAACLVTVAGLAYPRTRPLAALAGVAISTVALLSLVISYGTGLFGWQEVGLRAPITLAASFEAGAVILLTAALAAHATLPQARSTR
jgi:hypothetical protein